ncbi:MAG: hypothetical protein COA79_00990 [Planctomycetota bacterium]|nr:MAG: hypothetical protein COA79_00990 [Planctomycetota bacterium]
MIKKIKCLSFTICLLLIFGSSLMARDWYVSVAKGKGKKGTKVKPAKDLGNIISKLVGGDVVHIAEGVYLGRGKTGSNIIKVPVKIYGGYDQAFTKRDPWGAHKTILSGYNLTKNYEMWPALFIDLMKYGGPNSEIVVDGLIVDHAGRNRYLSEKRSKLIPMADPKTGKNPSPSEGGIAIRVAKSEKFDRGPRWKITVTNNIVMNTYGNGGSLSVSGYKGSTIIIDNNLVIQNSGSGIFCGSKYHGKAPLPSFTVTNNTILFTWDSGMSKGSNIDLDRNAKVTIKNNVLGFADIYAINNGYKCKNILLVKNLITGAKKADYMDFDTQMDVENMVDEAEYLHEDSDENITDAIKVPVSKDFALLYGSRVIVDRAKAEANVTASNSNANALRGMLGLPLQAGKVKWPKTPVYLNAISIDDAIAAGSKKYKGSFGCSKPVIK